MADINSILKAYWGHNKFRELQEEIILSVLNGKDTLALLPTGGGKSICFQVPALAMDGLCLVISPLIALMKDQVENLEKRGIPAATIISGMKQTEIDLILNKAITGQLKFLYISPERLESEKFIVNIPLIKVCLLAIDEAHCISQWGYDFRPPYLRIADIRTLLPKIPVIALTATATPEVVIDIQQKLAFKEPCLFQKSFARENLTYYVFKEENKLGRMLQIIQKVKGAGVVYVRNRKKTKEIADFLRKQGLSAAAYHAGLDQSIRNQRQSDWINDVTPIIVATNAFGMGIDKPNCRFVIHLDLPESLEAYFQEAGRAGRDGKRAHAVILYDQIDKINLEKNFATSYPEIKFIRKVYDLLGEYCRLPIGSGSGAGFDFDMNLFCSNYDLPLVETFGALKLIEQEGLITFPEEISHYSKLFIKTTKDEIYNLQVKNENYNALIDTMLRLYGGQLFSDFVNINESLIANKLKTTKEQIQTALENMHKFGYIEYIPKPLKSQIVWNHERIKTSAFSISPNVYQERKKRARARLDAVINYAESTNKCRSQLLLNYFGETDSKRCGRCDYCIMRNQIELNEIEFDKMVEIIKPFLSESPKSLTDIQQALKQFSHVKITNLLQWLLDNNKIQINANAYYSWISE